MLRGDPENGTTRLLAELLDNLPGVPTAGALTVEVGLAGRTGEAGGGRGCSTAASPRRGGGLGGSEWVWSLSGCCCCCCCCRCCCCSCSCCCRAWSSCSRSCSCRLCSPMMRLMYSSRRRAKYVWKRASRGASSSQSASSPAAGCGTSAERRRGARMSPPSPTGVVSRLSRVEKEATRRCKPMHVTGRDEEDSRAGRGGLGSSPTPSTGDPTYCELAEELSALSVRSLSSCTLIDGSSLAANHEGGAAPWTPGHADSEATAPHELVRRMAETAMASTERSLTAASGAACCSMR
mmetsp:Transcript_59/g.108  ORF Transcript_59/g.108 Transcript_59/m.108 type:complete len:293 (-) Transcript_59:611-1489(-)